MDSPWRAETKRGRAWGLGAAGERKGPGLEREDSDLVPDLSLALWGSPSWSVKWAPLVPSIHCLPWAGACPVLGRWVEEPARWACPVGEGQTMRWRSWAR